MGFRAGVQGCAGFRVDRVFGLVFGLIGFIVFLGFRV